MPNDCWNNITLKATNEQIRAILTTEFTDVPQSAFRLVQVGQEALVFKFWSADGPDRTRLNNLLNKYDGLWIKNEWEGECGMAGIFVGTQTDQQELAWDQGCIEEWGQRLLEVPDLPAPVLASDA